MHSFTQFNFIFVILTSEPPRIFPNSSKKHSEEQIKDFAMEGYICNLTTNLSPHQFNWKPLLNIPKNSHTIQAYSNLAKNNGIILYSFSTDSSGRHKIYTLEYPSKKGWEDIQEIEGNEIVANVSFQNRRVCVAGIKQENVFFLTAQKYSPQPDPNSEYGTFWLGVRSRFAS